MEFNPYQEWLGIYADNYDTISHYELLGIPLYEDDSRVIAGAVIERIGQVKQYQLGPRSSECQRLLTRLSVAKVTLSDPVKRREYDKELRQIEPEAPWFDVEPPSVAFPPIVTKPVSKRSSIVLIILVLASLAGTFAVVHEILQSPVASESSTTSRVATSGVSAVPEQNDLPTSELDENDILAEPTEPQPAAAPTEPVITESPAVAAVLPVPTSTNYFWMRGRERTRIVSAPDQFSFLSMIQGRFLGDGERIQLGRVSEGEWYLSGRGAQNIYGSATTLDCRGATFDVTEHRWSQGQSRKRLIHQDEGFCVLSAIGGGMHGLGEQISLSVDNDGYWYLEGRSQRNLYAQALSIKTDFAGGSVIKHRWDRGDRDVQAIHKEDGFCILSGFSGKFSGDAERVAVRLGSDGYWSLRCKSGQVMVAHAISIPYRRN